MIILVFPCPAMPRELEARAIEFFDDGSAKLEILEDEFPASWRVSVWKMFDPGNLECARKEFSRGKIIFWRQFAAVSGRRTRCVYDAERLARIRSSILSSEKEEKEIIDLLYDRKREI